MGGADLSSASGQRREGLPGVGKGRGSEGAAPRIGVQEEPRRERADHGAPRHESRPPPVVPRNGPEDSEWEERLEGRADANKSPPEEHHDRERDHVPLAGAAVSEAVEEVGHKLVAVVAAEVVRDPAVRLSCLLEESVPLLSNRWTSASRRAFRSEGLGMLCRKEEISCCAPKREVVYRDEVWTSKVKYDSA